MTPVRATVALLLALTIPGRMAAAPAWRTLQSQHFILVGDAGEKSLREVALHLEKFRAVIGRVLPKAKLSTTVPTVVVVFGSSEAYEPFGRCYQGKPVPVTS